MSDRIPPEPTMPRPRRRCSAAAARRERAVAFEAVLRAASSLGSTRGEGALLAVGIAKLLLGDSTESTLPRAVRA